MTKEKEFNQRFTAAVAAFKAKFGMEEGGGRFIIVASQPDGDADFVQMCGNGCVHESLNLADTAFEVLNEQAEAGDCGEHDPARN